jgi:tetratricopeptide (TPR) repeat protein
MPGNFVTGVAMRSEPRLQVLGFTWLAAMALTCQAGAAEQADRKAAAEILAPRLSELEQRLFDQIRDGRFGKFSLLEAGLIAGGVDRADELRRYGKRFDALAESLRRSGQVHGDVQEKARAVLAFLHRSILTGGYSLQASDVRQAFDGGRFNCVTASLLFNSLAERFGLKVVGLELPGHAMSRLVLPDETLDIETTSPRWPAGIDRPSSGRPRQPPRTVTEVELVATIYYNRGVDLLAEKDFAAAVSANAKALRLDPRNATAKGNFLATVNNWAIALATSGEYEKAAQLLQLGLATDPHYEPFRTNYVQLFRQWSEHLCMSGHYDDALRLLNQAADLQPGERFFREAAVEILRRWESR